VAVHTRPGFDHQPCTDERLATAARRTAERVFGLAELPPSGSTVTPGEGGARSA
jgi:hypothetical protein